MRKIFLVASLLTVLMCGATDLSVVVGQKAPTAHGDKLEPMRLDDMRLTDNTSSGFKIIPHFNGDIPDEARAAIMEVCEQWEKLICAPGSTTLNFNWADSIENPENIIETTIEYRRFDNGVAPLSLANAYHITSISLLEATADATIKINNAINWDCSFNSATTSESPNICFYTMRAIAHALGFSTSLCKKSLKDKTFPGFFVPRRYSPFDKLVFDSAGKRLSSIVTSGSRESAELNAFVCPPAGTDVYVLEPDDAHRLYAPTPFRYGQSLALLDNPASLMHCNPATGSNRLAVDDVTIEVLKAIGWQFENTTPDPIISINPLKANPEGVFCAYEPHEFVAITEGGGHRRYDVDL